MAAPALTSPVGGAGALVEVISESAAKASSELAGKISASGVMVANPPSFEAGKAADAFRVYKRDDEAATGWDSGVRRHYTAMRLNQSLAFSRRMTAKYGGFDHGEMTLREAFDKLKSYVDSSDPDTEHPNIEHMLQTAERARAAGEPTWLQLLALVHDIGKIMFLWGCAEDGQVGRAEGPQWALGGDTWIVGCRIPDCTVFPELNSLNPDMAAGAITATPTGIYKPGCGIMACEFAFGHDEYGYMWLKANGSVMPPEAFAMMRLHSCYPWHRGGAYRELHAAGDDALLAGVLRFNTYDLYSKSDAAPDVAALLPYYEGLIAEWFPEVAARGGKFKW